MAKKKKSTRKKKAAYPKAKYSDAAQVVFTDVQVVLERVANNAIQPISSSPHGRFWNTDRNSFVKQHVNMAMPLSSTFYVYLANDIMPPSPGPYATQEEKDLVKEWLTTGFS